MTAQRTQIVVIGGGYAGTLAANHLRLNADVDITVVNPRPVFVERIRLHQMVAGSGAAATDYGTLLGTGVRLVVDNAERIHDGTVELTSGAVLNYDYLIYAVGSTGVVPSAVPGAREFAYPIAEFEQAERLRAALDELHPDAPITVVGAGLTGIETASELAEQGRRVHLVCGGLLGPSLSRPGRRSVAKWLRRLGVTVLETPTVSAVHSDGVLLDDGAILRSALTIWTAGFGVPDLAARSGLPTDALGRLLTDETLTCVDDPRIVAAGDAVRAVGSPAADELPGRHPARRAGGEHGAQPHRRHPARGGQPGVHRAVHQHRPQIRHHPARPPRRHAAEPVHRRAGRGVDQGGGLQGHGVGHPQGSREAGLVLLAQGRQAGAASGRRGGRRSRDRADEHAERFMLLRPLLFTIAYEILGSTTESDDVLQDSYLRWAEVDLARVHDTKSYLAQLVTRQALNALRADARRREDYVGPWLPEPLLLDEQDPSADVVLAESVSMAMLVLLETLGPDERAVFVLREMFGFEYDEIAWAVGKSEPTVRQIAHRAREHVQARRKRFAPVDPEQNARIAAQFMAAAAGGDVQAVMSMLAPDVVWTADSGGKASAARRPVIGADKVARAIVGSDQSRHAGARRPGGDGRLQRGPAVLLYAADQLEGVFTVEIIDGRITNFYAMRNPDKLATVRTARRISRG